MTAFVRRQVSDLRPSRSSSGASALTSKRTLVQLRGEFQEMGGKPTFAPRQMRGPETVGTLPLPLRWQRMTEETPKEVLVVEDDPMIRIVATDALTERGIKAWEACDADEALHVLEQHPRIGLLFTDVNMPGKMNGLGLAHEVSVIRPDVELIVTSGAVTLADADLPDHGTFLPKPYRAERLGHLVAEKLDVERS